MPCCHPVVDLLNFYCVEMTCLQVANGLRIYFDKALQHMLLYPQEQEQSVKVMLLLKDFFALCWRHLLFFLDSGV
jgi:hypothetical protein